MLKNNQTYAPNVKNTSEFLQIRAGEGLVELDKSSFSERMCFDNVNYELMAQQFCSSTGKKMTY